MLTLPKHNRYDTSVIGERKDYSWPGGKRLAFCTTTNIEVYAYRKGTGWDPAKKGEPQQQRNYSWRELGNPAGPLGAVRAVRSARHPRGAQHQCALVRVLSANLRPHPPARRRGHRPRPHQCG